MNRQPILVLFALLFSCGGCAKSTNATRVAVHSTMTVANAAPDPMLVETHCPFGMPRKLSALHGPTQIIARPAYVLEHDAASKIALWVCGSLNPDLVFGDAQRRNSWKPEPELEGKSRAVDGDYRGSKFHRGHMVASEDRVATQVLNDETFVLSNAIPQNGPLNSGQWARLEAIIREWVRERVVTEAKIITGGFFYDALEDNPATADGIVEFQQIGRGRVAVPTHIFKVVVGRCGADFVAIAFVAENKKPAKNRMLTDQIVAIDWLEARTGLNFMPDLGPVEEAALEEHPSRMCKK